MISFRCTSTARLFAVVPLLAVACLLGAMSAPAGAVVSDGNCGGFSAIDASLTVWTGNEYGAPGNAPGSGGTIDVFGSLGHISLDEAYFAYGGECTISIDALGTKLVFKSKTWGPLVVHRELFIPSTGSGFVRVYDVFENTDPTTTDHTFSYATILNSGTNTVLSTSSGDNIDSLDDTWTVGTHYNYTEPDPVILVYGSPSGALVKRHKLARPFKSYVAADGATPAVGGDGWQNGEYVLSVPGGKTYALMHLADLGVAGPDPVNTGIARAQELSAGPTEVIGGLSEEEVSRIVNWDDLDHDGTKNWNDNCGATVNTDQGNVDKDRRGDACDDDADGDGLSNDAEKTIGTDWLKADTDGDGRKDPVDQCPRLAAATASGCPDPAVVPPARDATRPKVTLKGPKKLKLKKLRKSGIQLKLTCDEPVVLQVAVLASARKVSVAARFNFTLSERKYSLGKCPTKLKLKPNLAPLGKVKRGKRFKLRVRLVATDAAGNVTTRLRTVSIVQ